MSGGWSYTGCATHGDFCDKAVGSSRGDEEKGREGKYDEVDQVSFVLKRVEPNGARSWPGLPRRVVSSQYTLFACSSPFFSSTVYLFQLSTALKACSKRVFGKGNRRTV